MKRLTSLVLASGIMLASVGQAAVIAVSNFQNSRTANANITATTEVAFGFQWNNAAYSLSEVSVYAHRTAIGGETVSVYLYSNASGGTDNPGTEISLLGTFSTASAQTPTRFNITPSGVTSLQTGGKYWIVLESSGSSYWDAAANNDTAPYGFSSSYTLATALSYRRTIDDGQTWNGNNTLYNNPLIQLSAVPEPSQWAMMGVTILGAGGMGLHYRRKSTAAK